MSEETPRKRKLRLRAPKIYLSKRARRAFAALIGFVLIGGILWVLLNNPALSPAGEQALPEVENRDLELTDSQETYLAYGPWLGSNVLESSEVPVNDTGVAWLATNGTIDTSRYTVPVDGSWTVSNTPLIQTLTIDGEFVRLTNQKGSTYTIYVEQPFMFEGNHDVLYLVEVTGDVIELEQRVALRIRTLDDREES